MQCCKVKVQDLCYGICLPESTLDLLGISEGAGSDGAGSGGGGPAIGGGLGLGGFDGTTAYGTVDDGDAVVVVDLFSENCNPPGTSYCSELVREPPSFSLTVHGQEDHF